MATCCKKCGAEWEEYVVMKTMRATDLPNARLLSMIHENKAYVRISMGGRVMHVTETDKEGGLNPEWSSGNMPVALPTTVCRSCVSKDLTLLLEIFIDRTFAIDKCIGKFILPILSVPLFDEQNQNTTPIIENSYPIDICCEKENELMSPSPFFHFVAWRQLGPPIKYISRSLHQQSSNNSRSRLWGPLKIIESTLNVSEELDEALDITLNVSEELDEALDITSD